MEYKPVNNPPPEDVLRILELYVPLIDAGYHVYVPMIGLYEEHYRFYKGEEGGINFLLGYLEHIVNDDEANS